MATRLIFLPGLHGDPRIFRELVRYFSHAEVIEWITPQRRESITNYAARLAQTIGNVDGAIVVGVSFGGVIAQEVAVRQGAKSCVIISSIRNPSELPPHYRVGRMVARLPVENLLASAEVVSSYLPRFIRSRSKPAVATRNGNRAAWNRWAIGAVLRWEPTASSELKITHIHGDRDATFPIRYVYPDVTISGGGHLIALTHAKPIAEVIATCVH